MIKKSQHRLILGRPLLTRLLRKKKILLKTGPVVAAPGL